MPAAVERDDDKEWVPSPLSSASTPTHTHTCPRSRVATMMVACTIHHYLAALTQTPPFPSEFKHTDHKVCPSKYNTLVHISTTTTMFLFGGNSKEAPPPEEQQQQREQHQQQQQQQRQTSPSRRQTQQTAEEQKAQAEKEAHSRALLLMNAEQRGFLSYEVWVYMYVFGYFVRLCVSYDGACV